MLTGGRPYWVFRAERELCFQVHDRVYPDPPMEALRGVKVRGFVRQRT